MTITAEQAQALKAGITPGPWKINPENGICNQIDGEHHAVCTDQFCYAPKSEQTANTRADLPPTPSDAMRCPEVAALVEAMRNAIEAIDAAYDGPDDHGRYSTRERSALAALEQGARRE